MRMQSPASVIGCALSETSDHEQNMFEILSTPFIDAMSWQQASGGNRKASLGNWMMQGGTCLCLRDSILRAVHEGGCWQIAILLQVALPEELLLQAGNPCLHVASSTHLSAWPQPLASQTRRVAVSCCPCL